MIYLFTQIVVSLILAAIVGAAIGWLLHRTAAARQGLQLRQSIASQQQKLKQAETDVAMLTDDYDELKQRSQADIDALQQEIHSLAPLHANLEKSQLLVRQLMQKHEAQIRDISHQNESRDRKFKLLQDREQAFNKLQAELDLERRKNRALSIGAAAHEQPVSRDSASDTIADDDTTADELTSTGQPAVPQATIAGAVSAGFAAVAGSASGDEHNRYDTETIPDDIGNSVHDTDLANSEADVEARKSAHTEADAEARESSSTEADAEARESSSTEADAEARESTSTEPDTSAGVEAHASASTAASATVRVHESATRRGWASATVPDVQSTVQPAGQTIRSNNQDDNPRIFEPVEQHDDLQQIFGIGPATEKKLNALGITSYSQLAKLNPHEIQEISDALQIFPGSIEKDDWIGKARQQLEEVLEEL